MKKNYYIILIILFIGIVIYFYNFLGAVDGIKVLDLNTDQVQESNTITIELDGITFDTELGYVYNFTKNNFMSFDDFANDMEQSYITDLIKLNSNDNQSEAEVKEILNSFEGHYTFERVSINDFNAIVHKRDFFGMVENVYEVYIFTDNNILSFSEELDHNKLNNILKTIR